MDPQSGSPAEETDWACVGGERANHWDLFRCSASEVQGECQAQGDKEEAVAPSSRARLKRGVWITGKAGYSGSHRERRTQRPG